MTCLLHLRDGSASLLEANRRYEYSEAASPPRESGAESLSVHPRTPSGA